jgi:hypothetical protein
LDAGDSFEDVAAWLAAQDDIADVIGEPNAIRFRVTDGSAMVIYDPGPGVSRPAPSEAPARAALEAAVPGTAPKAVLREDDSESNIKKRALFIEPFEEFIATPTGAWKTTLEELHDYERVDYFANQNVLDQHFASWNDYRFVWVTTHGKHFPTDSPEHSALFSGRMCEESGWIQSEVEAGRGDEVVRENITSIRGLFGRPRSYIESVVTPEQKIRWDQYENDSLPDSDGIHCGPLKQPWIFVPGYEPGDSPIFDVRIKYWYYDEMWFRESFPSGLKDVFVYQRACTSDKLPVEIASGSRGAILGWSDIINSADDDLTIGVLFDRLIREGETLQDAMVDVFEAGFHEFTRGEKNPKLKVVSDGSGERHFRIRENISIVDPALGIPFPDEGGQLDAREITAEGSTIVDITVKIEGFGDLEGDEIDAYKLRFYDGNGSPISQEWDVDEPHDGLTFMTIPVSLNQAVRNPVDVDIEARVTLPEGSGNPDARHRIKLTVRPAIEALWQLNVGSGGNASGSFVFAPFPQAIFDSEGRTIWQVTLAQLDDRNVPNATLLIVDHQGRNMDCTGATGTFGAFATVIFNDSPMPTEGFGGGLGEGECGDFINVNIESFNKEDDLVATVSGTICHWRKVGMEEVVTPVPISGRFQMPSAGCGADPGGDLVGSYYAAQEPSLCFDIYPNAAIAPAFDASCAMGGGLICSDDPCPSAGQIGQCDYTDDSVQITFRGQVQHYYSGGGWPSAGELQLGCELQLGVWTTGEPPQMQ